MGPKFVCKTLDILHITVWAKYEAMCPKVFSIKLDIEQITLGAKYEAVGPKFVCTTLI